MKLGMWMLCIAAAAPLLAAADDAPPPPPEGVWTGKGQAGYVSSKGNTDSKSANVALDMALVEGPWKHAFHLGGLYGQSAGVVSAERWDTAWQSNHDLTANVFAFGGLRYQHDMFSGFQYQASGTAGLGYKIFDTDATKLSAQIGVGYRRLRPEDLTLGPSGGVSNRTLEPAEGSAVGTLGATYSQALSGTTTLSDKLLVESGSTDTLITNALALAVKISTKLALSVGYNIQDNTKPPANLKKLDTLETVNLVYSF
jgi:putative salt-induced outer membrane protein